MYSAAVPIAILFSTLFVKSPVDDVNVYAAASLKDAFTSIARSFESEHAGIKVNLNFAGSQTLAAQIANGAPADIFASASLKNLEAAKPEMSTVKTFATNRLTVVYRKTLKRAPSLRELASLPRVVVADASVPAGKYAIDFLIKAEQRFGSKWLENLKLHTVSHEVDVRSVLAKVRLGEADAGIVYVSDAVASAGQVGVVSIPAELNVVAQYPVALTSFGRKKDAARKFFDYLFQPVSKRTLKEFGFSPPGPAQTTRASNSGTSMSPSK